MTDRIEPAWNPDMLSWFQNDPDDVRLALDRGMDCVAYYLKGDLPRLIALANAALPDSDPRKITRQKLTFVRQLMGAHEDEEKEFLDALASYLPPETP